MGVLRKPEKLRTELISTPDSTGGRRTTRSLRSLLAAVVALGITAACLPIEIEVKVSNDPAVMGVPADVHLSLADNPLVLTDAQVDVLPEAEGEEAPLLQADVPNDDPVAATLEIEDPAAAPATTGRPLTRVVAESIVLDAEVVPVGWESFVQDGVVTSVWRVTDFAAGWHQNSRLPGQGGNIVLSAHHNIKGQVFRYTVDLEPGDLITLYDEERAHEYRVEDKFILKDKGEPEAVRQENARWIGPFDEERLTLITCWPFNSNTHRLIVIAKPAGQAQAAVD